MKFRVEIREVHVSTRIVEADSKEDAINRAFEGDEVSCEYSHTLEDSPITAEKIQD